MTHWHKRVPADMAAEYIAKGWVMTEREGLIVTLVWPKEGTPP